MGATREEWDQSRSSLQTILARVRKRREQIEKEKQDRQTKLGPGEVRKAQGKLSQSKDAGNRDRLLVVDDNEMNRDMLSRRLKRQGYIVDVAVNGKQALEMIRTHKFDLVLLDIMMPVMNGYQVLEEMKDDEDLTHIPVIMITAVDEIDSIVKCIELGAEDYLPKPFNPVLLRARLGASLEKKRLRDQREAFLQQLNLENERKSEELERARNIQLSMLPTRPPVLDYLDIAARQETASEVGGDYYDFFPQANGKLRVAIGDATGHGVASGLMVAMTKASLMATNVTNLSALVRKINQILTKIDLGSQLNMALLLLEISLRDDGSIQIEASGGGIPPIYILRATGETEEILISGFPLGIRDDLEQYSPTRFRLTQGDVVVLVSDGLPERFNSDLELLGFDRLFTELEEIDVIPLSASEVLAQVADIGDRWGEDHPMHDDLTLVVLKVQ